MPVNDENVFTPPTLQGRCELVQIGFDAEPIYVVNDCDCDGVAAGWYVDALARDSFQRNVSLFEENNLHGLTLTTDPNPSSRKIILNLSVWRPFHRAR